MSLADTVEILNRHATLDFQISSLGLMSVDVQGDSNCLFRSVSFVLFGHENAHSQLRKAAVSVLEQGGSKMFDLIDKSIDNGLPFQDHLRRLYTKGEEVGQDIIMALAIAIKHSVSVYIAYANPQTFHPNDDVLDTDPLKSLSMNLGITVP